MTDSKQNHRAAMDRTRGEIPPAEDGQLEPGTLVFENQALAKGFTSVPNYILRDPAISVGAKAVFSLLLSYAWQEGSCFPGQERLAKELGTHKRSVIRWLQELIERKVIARRRRGMGKTNIYYILDFKPTHTKAEVTKSALLEVTNTGPLEVTKTAHNEYSEEEYTEVKDTDLSNSKGKALKEIEGDEQKETEIPPVPSGAIAKSNGSKLAAAALGGEEEQPWSEPINHLIRDLTKHEFNDLGDPTNIFRNAKRAMRLWRQSKLSEEEFLDLIYQARQTTKEHSATIRKTAGGNIGLKNRAPYFFGVLQNLIAEKNREKVEELRRKTLQLRRMSP